MTLKSVNASMNFLALVVDFEKDALEFWERIKKWYEEKCEQNDFVLSITLTDFRLEKSSHLHNRSFFKSKL